MSAVTIAKRHVDEAFAEAEHEGCGTQTVGRHIIDAVIAHFLKTRSVEDVQRELRFMCDTIDPETDYIFMRP